MMKPLLNSCVRQLKVAALFGFAAAGAVPAFAQDASTTLNVHATVTPTCVVRTTPVDFGRVDTTTARDVLGTGALLVTCTSGLYWNAAADQGSGEGADIKTRRMTGEDGKSILAYHLFTDSARTAFWGNGKEGSSFRNTGTGEEQEDTIYATIPAGQRDIPTGEYRDTVRVTINY